MKILFQILFSLPLLANGQAIDTSQYAVIKFDSLEKIYIVNEIFPIHSRPADLDKTEIAHIELLLETCITEYNKNQEHQHAKEIKIDPQLKYKLTIPLQVYQRQYVPVLTTENEKLVYVNCFCSAHDEWRKELIEANDMGKCYFQLMVDLTKNKYYSLFVEENHP